MLLELFTSIAMILMPVGGGSVNADEAALNSTQGTPVGSPTTVEEAAWKRSSYRDCYERPPWAFGRFFLHADSELTKLRSTIRSVTLTVVEDQFDEVFDHLAAFAVRNRFVLRIRPTTEIHGDITIDLWRQDVRMMIIQNPFDPEIFTVAFLGACSDIVPAATLDEIVEDLRQLIVEVPGATLSEPR